MSYSSKSPVRESDLHGLNPPEYRRIPLRAIGLMLTCSLFASIAIQAQAPSAPASSASTAPPACDGSYNVVRVSEIKPGMMSTFMKAVAGHQAWYAAAGAPDKIVAMRVIDRDPATKVQSYSETQMVTSHVEPVKRDHPLPPEGDSYKAFADLYKQSSTITAQYHTCMPAM